MHSERLMRSLQFLKNEFYAAGKEWVENRDAALLEDLHALIGAINELEVFIYKRKITTLLDIV